MKIESNDGQAIERHVTKIKIGDGPVLREIEYVEKNLKTGERKTISLSTSESPQDSFFNQFERLKYAIAAICELPDDPVFMQRLTATGISFKHKDGVMGVVITGQLKTKGANAPLIINTPHVDDNPDSNACLDAGPYTCVRMVLVKANKFIDGDRKYQQLDLFEEAEAASKAADEEQSAA